MMNDTAALIIKSLGAGEKSRAQIADALDLAPTQVAGALVTLARAGQVMVSGQIRIKGKDVSIYALANGKPLKKGEVPRLHPLSDEAIALLLSSNLYETWGGYAQLDMKLSRKLVIRKHIEH